MLRFIAVAAFGAAVRCQQVSTLTPEVHPSFSWKTCTSGKQCTAQSGKLTLDSNFRGVFKVNSTEYCFQGNMWSMMLCPDDVTCTKNCALNGEDVYAYDGVASSSGELRLVPGADPYH
jgi:cellulose 1,4-beta-cellobiosidase